MLGGDAKIVGMQILKTPHSQISKYTLGIKLKLAFFQKPNSVSPVLEEITNDAFRKGPVPPNSEDIQ